MPTLGTLFKEGGKGRAFIREAKEAGLKRSRDISTIFHDWRTGTERYSRRNGDHILEITVIGRRDQDQIREFQYTFSDQHLRQNLERTEEVFVRTESQVPGEATGYLSLDIKNKGYTLPELENSATMEFDQDKITKISTESSGSIDWQSSDLFEAGVAVLEKNKLQLAGTLPYFGIDDPRAQTIDPFRAIDVLVENIARREPSRPLSVVRRAIHL